MNYCTYIPKSKILEVYRIVVIGDIHGDWLALTTSLKISKVIDINNNWIGGKTHVVQVGDLMDRAFRTGTSGEDEKSESKILDYLIKLKQQAIKAGGDIHLLIGNHEMMNVEGDFRYVSDMGMTDFNGKRKEMFKPGGKVAKLLACNSSSVIQIGSWVFSHAGITSQISKKYTVDQVNDHVRQYLLGNTNTLINPNIMDIFWHRRYDSENSCYMVHDALEHWKARNMAVGHTVQSDGINSLCNRSLWRVDIGMSNAFGKSRPIEVLEILNDGATINILQGKKED